MEWLPGETAPKDGTKILAWTALGYEVTEWCLERRVEYVPSDVPDLYRLVERVDGFWNGNVPLFWMPLPPAKSEAETEAARQKMLARYRAEGEMAL